jgi:hypothetical protein
MGLGIDHSTPPSVGFVVCSSDRFVLSAAVTRKPKALDTAKLADIHTSLRVSLPKMI